MGAHSLGQYQVMSHWPEMQGHGQSTYRRFNGGSCSIRGSSCRMTAAPRIIAPAAGRHRHTSTGSTPQRDLLGLFPFPAPHLERRLRQRAPSIPQFKNGCQQTSLLPAKDARTTIHRRDGRAKDRKARLCRRKQDPSTTIVPSSLTFSCPSAVISQTLDRFAKDDGHDGTGKTTMDSTHAGPDVALPHGNRNAAPPHGTSSPAETLLQAIHQGDC